MKKYKNDPSSQQSEGQSTQGRDKQQRERSITQKSKTNSPVHYYYDEYEGETTDVAP